MPELSSNELFSKRVISNTSKLLNIPEDVVDSVLSSIILQVLQDINDQGNESSDTIVVRVPKIADITLLASGKNITVSKVYLVPKFRNKVKTSFSTDIDYLFEEVMKNSSKLIVDKFTKIIASAENEDY